jgi:hypothetical protein
MENISKVEHAYVMSRDNMKNKQQALYLTIWHVPYYFFLLLRTYMYI